MSMPSAWCVQLERGAVADQGLVVHLLEISSGVMRHLPCVGARGGRRW